MTALISNAKIRFVLNIWTFITRNAKNRQQVELMLYKHTKDTNKLFRFQHCKTQIIKLKSQGTYLLHFAFQLLLLLYYYTGMRLEFEHTPKLLSETGANRSHKSYPFT